MTERNTAILIIIAYRSRSKTLRVRFDFMFASCFRSLHVYIMQIILRKLHIPSNLHSSFRKRPSARLTTLVNWLVLEIVAAFFLHI